jgi:diguanylate cyclase (GGDEF)-like protein/PAS domain S-box-containing protein
MPMLFTVRSKERPPNMSSTTRLSAILRVTSEAALVLASGVRGPDAVRTILERVGEATGAERASFTAVGIIPSSMVWGAASDRQPVDVIVTDGEHDRGILHLWADPLEDAEREAVTSLGAVLVGLSGPVAPDGSDVDRWLRLHLDSIPVVTYTEYPDEDHTFGYAEVYVSAQIERMLGYTPREWVEDDDMDRWLDAIHPDDRERYETEIERSARTGDDYQVEYRMRHKITNDWVWVRDVARLVHVEGDAHPYWHGVMIDITERKRLEEQIAFLAYHDSLTGLANRERFVEELDLGLARAERTDASVAVAFLDLNGFKEVNDTYGHDVGDGLLRAVAARLDDATRATDLVARLGGDEFLVLVADIEHRVPSGPHLVGPTRARAVVGELAERIDAALATPFIIEGHQLTTGAAIGVSIFPEDADDARTLMKHADIAMYAVKRAGGHGYAAAGDVIGREAASG